MVPDLIDGRYRIEQEVGRGGMGVVLRAFDTRLNRTVALKTLPPDAAHDSEKLHRLSTEARAASALNHPCIATVYDFVEQGTDRFIVYEYIDGCTLRNKLAVHQFSSDDILSVGIQLTDALVAAHTHSITHRDLKPENIMLLSNDPFDQRVKILDFGLAQQRRPPLSAEAEASADTISVVTVPGLLLGTVNYMAPEQLESHPVDGRTDIYALGLVLYEMAAGVNPFAGRTPPSTIANILKQEAPPLSLRNPAVPAELERILLKCLHKNPEDRYQSAVELCVDLRNLRQFTARSAATQDPASITSRFFLLFGTTPDRRWEVMHLRMFLWCLLLAYLGWRYMQSAAGRWGFSFFLLEAVCIVLITVCLSFLLYMRTVSPDGLPREVRRLAPWIRILTFALVLVTWAMTATVVTTHPILAAFLFLCGTAGGLKYILFKTVLDRAILPKPNSRSFESPLANREESR